MYVAPDKMEFRVVFEGRLVDGFTHENVRNAFQSRFGEATTCAVFGKSQAVIKKGLNREQAEMVKARLAELGMDVSIEEVMPVGYGLSIVEEEGGRALPGAGANRPAANDAHERGVPRGDADRYAANDTFGIREIEAAFTGTLELPGVSRPEALRTLARAMLMLAMPLAYLLVALTALRVLLWMTFGGRQAFFGLADPGFVTVPLYVAALSACALGTLVIAKPLLARPKAGARPVTVEPVREQALFAFVEEMAETVGAPMPDDVVFDTGTGVSTRGARGPFASEFTLTIGLPLIWGLDVRSIAGLLAREMGWFADARQRRARYVARWVDGWFRQRIDAGDQWDDVVERFCSSDLRIAQAAGRLAERGVGLCRLLLRRLADVATRVGEPIIREADIEAGRCQAAIIGVDRSEQTAELLAQLKAAHRDVVADLDDALDGGRMVENLPALVARRAGRMDGSEPARMSSAGEEGRAEDSLCAESEAGFGLEGPATALVRDLERLSCGATLEWYRAHGIDVAADDLIPLADFESESETLKRATDANHHYFRELSDLPMYLPLPERALAEKISTGKLVAGLGTLKEKYRGVRIEAAGRRDRLYLQREYQRYYQQAGFWADAGSPVDVDTYRLKLATSDPKEIEGYLTEHRKSEKALAEELRSVLDLLGKRLGVGLELARRIDPGCSDEIDGLREAYAAVSATFDDARQLEDSCIRLELLAGFCDQVGNKPEQQKRVDAEMMRNLRIRERIRECCAAVRDPFRPEVTLDFAFPDSPTAGSPDPRELLEDGAETLRRLERLAFRLRGRMAELALEAERHHGVL